MWTLKELQEKLKAGKIKGFLFPEPPVKLENKSTGGRIIGKYFPKRSKELDWIAWNLWIWCCENKHKLFEEYKFSEERNFRSDWAIEIKEPYALKLLIEYEGLMSEKSGHTTVTGYTKDTEKYTLAAKLGFRVLRYTALNYRNLIKDLNDIVRAHEGL